MHHILDNTLPTTKARQSKQVQKAGSTKTIKIAKYIGIGSILLLLYVFLAPHYSNKDNQGLYELKTSGIHNSKEYLLYGKPQILLVAHSYAPHSGGTEQYIEAIAQELLRRNYNVSVLVPQKYDQDKLEGVNMYSNSTLLDEQHFDLILVHDCGPQMQSSVLSQVNKAHSKVLFLLVEPWRFEMIDNCRKGLETADYIGWSIPETLELLIEQGYFNKGRQIDQGIELEKALGKPGFRKKYSINSKYMFYSSGGFQRHKGHVSLAEAFHNTTRNDVTLVISGYTNVNSDDSRPNSTDKMKVLYLEDLQDTYSALSEMDLYILNSDQEGFGIVLLQAMANKKPWISRMMRGGGRLMSRQGYVYREHLSEILESFYKDDEGYYHIFNNTYKGAELQSFIREHRSVQHTVNQIESVIYEAVGSKFDKQNYKNQSTLVR